MNNDEPTWHAQGDAVHFIVPTWKDAEDIREGARKFWQKRNMAPPNEVNNNYTPKKPKNKKGVAKG